MLGQYGLGSSSAYGQRRAPLGFGGSGQSGYGQTPSYGAYTPPQSLGQAPQTQYSSYTPPGTGGLGSQPMGASRYGGLGGGTAAQTLPDGGRYHIQLENTFMGNGPSGLGNMSRADASRLNRGSEIGFIGNEVLQGLGDTNMQGYGYNQYTRLAEQSPWAPQATQPVQQADNGLGGMTFDPSSNSWVYGGLQNPNSLRGTMQGDTGLSYGASPTLNWDPQTGHRLNTGIPAGLTRNAPNPYAAVNNPGYLPGVNP